MTGKFEANREGIGDMLCSTFMIDHMRLRGEAIKARAEATAPVYLPGPHPGRYKAAFHLEAGIRTGHETRRAHCLVWNDAPEAFWVEFGNVNVPRHRTLGHALEAARF